MFFVCFKVEFQKNYCHLLQFFKFQNFISKFEAKIALFGYFWTAILKKTILIFEINILEFVEHQNFIQNSGLKNVFIWVLLGLNLKKRLLSYLKFHICVTANVGVRIKVLKFSIKSALIWEFLSWNFKKLLSYLKSTRSTLPNCKITGKNKNV